MENPETSNVPLYKLEDIYGVGEEAVEMRRKALGIDDNCGIPFRDFEYSRVHGRCCENILGYVKVPVGYAGPLVIDGVERYIPMATTEGALIASTHRGCKAINLGGGAHTTILDDGMTRAPCVTLPSAKRAADLKSWLRENSLCNAGVEGPVAATFNATSRFARLQSVKAILVGRFVYIRLKASTGDAMGMNMLSKGTEAVLSMLRNGPFPDLAIVSLSGNVCTDKKASALNWIEGRGKSVVAECTLRADIVEKVLRVSVSDLVSLNVRKNLMGSAVAGTVAGAGSNAHAANVVAAIFIATGQDPAQVVESSSCMTLLDNDNGNLHVSCTMPCLEVGTIGGGTELEAQAACLDLMGNLSGPSVSAGSKSCQLASAIASTVMAAELSLLASLVSGTLVSSHLSLNRAKGQ